MAVLIRLLLSWRRRRRQQRRRVPSIPPKKTSWGIRNSPAFQRRMDHAARKRRRAREKAFAFFKAAVRECFLFSAVIASVWALLPREAARSGPGKTWVYINPETSELLFRGGELAATPFSFGGKWYWDAYVCRSDTCPERRGDGRLSFFQGPPPGDSRNDGVECPFCRGSGKGGGKPDRDCYADRPPARDDD